MCAGNAHGTLGASERRRGSWCRRCAPRTSIRLRTWRGAGADVAGHWPSRWLRGFVTLPVGAALVFSLATQSAPLASTHRVLGDDAAATVIARYRARIPELMAEQGVPGLAVALVDRDQTCGSRASATSIDGLRSRERRHGLQRPVDVEAVHGHSGHAGRRGGSARPRRADHHLSPRVHRPQRIRGTPRTEDHAPDAPEPHRGLHARGAGREQQRARPRRFRRPREQHLRHLAAIPGRQRLRLLEPRDRPRRLHPRASRGQALRRR